MAGVGAGLASVWAAAERFVGAPAYQFLSESLQGLNMAADDMLHGIGLSDLDIESLQLLMWEREAPAAAADAFSYLSIRGDAAISSLLQPAGDMGIGVPPGVNARGVGSLAGNQPTRSIGQFFYDPRSFRTISREYWAANGPADGASLHHWLFPQRASWIPQGLRNAGFNLLELPAGPTSLTRGLGLNQWMGFAPKWGGAQAAAAFAVENGIRLAIPGAIAGGGYGGYELGSWLADDE